MKDGQAKLSGNDTIRNAVGEDLATARDVIVYSKSDDLAVLRLSDPLPNTPASIDCTRAHVGQEISIVGSPGQLGFVTTWGRVAGEQRKWDQWDAVIVLQGLADAGNSGGPVFDTATGKVVGVLVAGVTPRDSLYYLAVPATSICYLLGL